MSIYDPLSGCDPDVVSFEVKPGKLIYLRALDGAGRDAYVKLASAADGGSISAHDIAALGIIRSETDHALAYVTDEQKAILSSKDGELLKLIALKLMEISGLRQTAVEEEQKNS